MPWLKTLLLPAMLICGCAEDSNLGVVTGTVRVDGEPAKTGGITYIPIDGASGTSGAMILDGQYTARNVPIGSHKVQINLSRIVGYQKLYNTPDSPTHPVLEEMLPEKYNVETELTLDVKPGKNEKNYDLSSK